MKYNEEVIDKTEYCPTCGCEIHPQEKPDNPGVIDPTPVEPVDPPKPPIENTEDSKWHEEQFDWDKILHQCNINDTVVINTAGNYGIPVTGLKELKDYLDRDLRIIDITKYKDRDKITTKVPMNHYQIIKCFLVVEYPNKKQETLMFEYSNDTDLVVKLGTLGEKEYTYDIGSFKCFDTTTVMSYRKIGDYFDNLPNMSTSVLPVSPLKILALTTNRNLIQE